MRLVTYREAGEDRVGVLYNDAVIDVQRWLSPPSEPMPTTMQGIVEMGGTALERLNQWLGLNGEEAARTAPRLDALQVVAPLPRPRRNVLCVGHNYAAHMVEQGLPVPARPTIFTKATTAVMGPYDAIRIDPAVSEQIDWEVELGVVIGQGGRGIKRDQALNHVFGYLVLNDISARDIQSAHGGQFFLGKSLDGSCPIGPWIVTADELSDPQGLRVLCRVNGEVVQDSNTSDMVFTVATLIEWLAKGMTLEPGDIIATGTPGGVGHFRQPPRYLRPGDVLETEIEGIGVMRNPVEAAAAAA